MRNWQSVHDACSRPSHGSQCVLVVCGYRFGDTHINLELDRALRESAGDLTIVVFTSDNGAIWPVRKLAQRPLRDRTGARIRQPRILPRHPVSTRHEGPPLVEV